LSSRKGEESGAILSPWVLRRLRRSGLISERKLLCSQEYVTKIYLFFPSKDCFQFISSWKWWCSVSLERAHIFPFLSPDDTRTGLSCTVWRAYLKFNSCTVVPALFGKALFHFVVGLALYRDNRRRKRNMFFSLICQPLSSPTGRVQLYLLFLLPFLSTHFSSLPSSSSSGIATANRLFQRRKRASDSYCCWSKAEEKERVAKTLMERKEFGRK
jgi:hypothetical protein